MEKDWDEINADILRLIANKVGDIADFIRLRAVCKHWRSEVHPSDLPPQLPWFIDFEPDFTNSRGVVKAFSIYSNKTYSLPCNSHVDLFMNSVSSSGYLYKSDYFSQYQEFINPLTGVEVSFHLPLYSSSSNSSLLVDVTSTSNPRLDKQGMDVLFLKHACGMDQELIGTSTCLWRYCEQKWARIFEVSSADIIMLHCYCDGKLYIINYNSTEINVIDVATSKVVSVIQSPPHVYFHYLIDACGELLGIQYNANYTDAHSEFVVYRLDDTSGNPFWTQLTEGISDRMLFLRSSEFKGAGFCLDANYFAGVRSNCIYMNDIYGNPSKQRLKRFDFRKGKSEILQDGDLNRISTWFIPSLC